ncbi:MAG: membrane protein insertion efficiency factor YidD [Actinomycetota bacterium]
MRDLLRIPSLLLIGLIRLYQLSIARALPQRCRFHPSCSEYAIRSLRERGLIRGAPAAAWRVLRCGPWSAGGLDPVRVPRMSETVDG